MLILAIDTSTNAGTVALYSSESWLVGEISINIKKTHSENIMVAIDLSLIHISEPTRLRRISYAVFCLTKKNCYTHLRTR